MIQSDRFTLCGRCQLLHPNTFQTIYDSDLAFDSKLISFLLAIPQIIHQAGASWHIGSLVNVSAFVYLLKNLHSTSSANKPAELDFAYRRSLNNAQHDHLTQYWGRGKRLDLVNESTKRTPELKTNWFRFLFLGVTLSRESDGVWLYNRSSSPVFVHSPTLCDMDSRTTTVHKVPPGHCLRAFDPLKWVQRKTYPIFDQLLISIFLLESTNPSNGHHRYVVSNSVPSIRTALE